MRTISFQNTVVGIGRVCRTVALGVISGACRRVGFHEWEARISALPLRDQAWITAATLALLFGLSLFFAQFGLIGLAIYLALIVLVVG